MTDDLHPEVAAVLKQAQRLQDLMDEKLNKMDSESFTATDESETVEVTLNEALQNATAEATASIDADRERLDAVVAEITANLTDERQ